MPTWARSSRIRPIDAEVITRLRYMFEAGGWVLEPAVMISPPISGGCESGPSIEQPAALHEDLGADVGGGPARGGPLSGRAYVPGLDAAVGGHRRGAPSLRAAVP